MPFAPDGDKLEASAQSGFFGTDAFALDAPARQPPVFFDPAAVMSAGKKLLRQFDLRSFEDAALVAFQADQIIGPP